MKINPIKYQEAPKVLTVFFSLTHQPLLLLLGFLVGAQLWGGGVGASLDDSVAEGRDHHDKLVLRSMCHIYIQTDISRTDWLNKVYPYMSAHPTHTKHLPNLSKKIQSWPEVIWSTVQPTAWPGDCIACDSGLCCSQSCYMQCPPNAVTPLFLIPALTWWEPQSLQCYNLD